jgi:hypothetical protein
MVHHRCARFDAVVLQAVAAYKKILSSVPSLYDIAPPEFQSLTTTYLANLKSDATLFTFIHACRAALSLAACSQTKFLDMEGHTRHRQYRSLLF